jgi:predicted nucleotidyltransferase
MGLKRADNLKLLYESGLARFLLDSFPGATLIVFGSYSTGEDTAASDIDIAVVGSKKADPDTRKFEAALERKISLHYFRSFREMDRNLRNNIAGGMLLKGAVDL